MKKIAKILAIQNETNEEVIYEHHSDNMGDAQKSAREKYKGHRFPRCWFGFAGESRIGRLKDSTSDLIKDIMSKKPKENNVREIEIDYVFNGEKRQSRNKPCFCGSGKKYKKCHYLTKRLS